jgi:hypothetical protein
MVLYFSLADPRLLNSLLDMREQHVFDPLISKRSQYLLATQLVKMILKVHNLFFFSIVFIFYLILFIVD